MEQLLPKYQGNGQPGMLGVLRRAARPWIVTSDMIEGIGVANVGKLLNRLPSIVSEVTGTSDNVVSPTDSGIRTIGLHNLGSARTLILVNGHRFVSGMSASSGYGVDLNVIPISMIERIEVLTGGQSAV